MRLSSIVSAMLEGLTTDIHPFASFAYSSFDCIEIFNDLFGYKCDLLFRFGTVIVDGSLLWQ